MLRVLNKRDLVDQETVAILSKSLDGIPIAANSGSTLTDLIEKMEAVINKVTPRSSVPFWEDSKSLRFNTHLSKKMNKID